MTIVDVLSLLPVFVLLFELILTIPVALRSPDGARISCCGSSKISAEPIYHSLVLEFYAGLVLHWVRMTNNLAEKISRSDVFKGL